jgi:3D (Asp-Asp-Asp) domain-containing protein
MRIAATIFAALALVFATVIPASAATSSTMYVTGYSYWDNDPPGSGEIAFPKSDGYPTVHNTAAGNGTFSNPTTIAVGLVNGVPQFKPGTKLYIPSYRRYFVVEDSCAACGKGHNGYKWVDVWVDGRTSTVDSADACMNKITGLHKVYVNPPNGYSVPTASVIASNNACIRVRDDTLVSGPLT